jgi:hypothetical protein
MSKTITIGNAQGFWGDSPDAPKNLLAQQPDLDFLTLDYMAEVSMSILAIQRSRDPEAGYARDFLGVVKSLVPYWQDGGKAKIVCNAGGLNPEGCARAVLGVLQEAGLDQMKVGLVTGDDVIKLLQEDPGCETFHNWESGESARTVEDRLVTANAYIGATPVVEALAQGADILVTGRVADPSLTLACCMHAFGWSATDWNKIAAGTVAGHLLECGTQACGGISTDWLDLEDAAHIGFPVVEVSEDGSLVVTKPGGTGGAVTRKTVTEQLLYEIGDPANYISPDCHVDFTSLTLHEEGENRIGVRDVTGRPPTDTYKVSATYQDGWWAQGMLTLFGRDAVKKAERCGEIIFTRLKDAGFDYARTNVEVIGANACAGGAVTAPANLMETVLRVSVADPRKEAVQRFAREIAPLVTSGPQGTTGYAAGRPKPSPVFAYWPCLIEKERVQPRAALLTVADL